MYLSTNSVCPECLSDGFHKMSCSKSKYGDTYAGIKMQLDPNGIDQHQPGAKLDLGKNEVSLIMEGFARALLEVAKVATYGANKYTRNGWETVPDGVYRYSNAAHRHYFGRIIDGDLDPESQLFHEAHEIWNKLAAFELKLRGGNE